MKQGLFSERLYPAPAHIAAGAAEFARRKRARPRTAAALDPTPDSSFMEIFERARNPSDADELLRLYLGRVEAQIGPLAGVPNRSDLTEEWSSSLARRKVTSDEVLGSASTVRMIKELFNFYFRDDLYGRLRRDSTVILSSGSVDEDLFGLPDPLRDCIHFALDRNWYGYSDSRGRDASREAIARYETSRIDGVSYTRDNVCIGLGGTVLIGAVADLVLSGTTAGAPALCGIPNYPPLVQAVARRAPVQLVPVLADGGEADVTALVAAVQPTTPLVLLQSAMNPTGSRLPDRELARLLAAAGPSTMIVLDECHEWLPGAGEPEPRASHVRGDSRVVRISSLSKTWSAPGLKVGWLVADSGFVDEFYEYSSTTFGGPPSFFYTLVEVLARMENWLISGIEDLGPVQLAEFESSYGLTVPILSSAYRRYTEQRRVRAVDLLDLRDASVGLLQQRGLPVHDPTYSINMAVPIAADVGDYTLFRRLLGVSDISVFPGVLTMALSSGAIRVTTARSWPDIERGVGVLAGYLAQPSSVAAAPQT